MAVTVADFAEVKRLTRTELIALAHREGIPARECRDRTNDGLRLAILLKRAEGKTR